MTWWPGALVIAAAIFLAGWRAHLWWCKRRPGCPAWLEERAKEWNVKRELNGWHRRRKKNSGGEAKTTGDPWAEWCPAPPIDDKPKTGIPSERMETPITGVANPKRKTTP